MDFHGVLILFSYMCAKISGLQCPFKLQTTECTCRQETWWNNEIRTTVNCSTANLFTVPNFEILRKYEITHLILSNNNISEISLKDFTDISIHEIDLSFNPIVKYDSSSSLSPLPRQLKSLIMKKNKIFLDQGLHFFKGLENLTELILDYNALKNDSQILPDKIFQDLFLNSLTHLSLQSCEIGGISKNAFMGLENLEELDLSYNYLETIPEAVHRLSNLRKLILLGNNIMRLTDYSLRGLLYLRDLNLNVNDISKIDVNAFAGLENSLKDVRLHYNNLNTFPFEAFRKLKQLSFLVLSRNNIQLIPKNSFVGFGKLKILELDSNSLIYYDEMFHGLENSLETLTLRETGLRSLPFKSLARLRYLADLDISRNAIHTLFRGDIGGLRLKTIDISNNELAEIKPHAFAGISRTIGIDLDNNKLSNISFVLDVTPCAFSYIDVSGNDILCDCDTEKIINSGIVLGVGPTGHCVFQDDVSNRKYKLGTSLLSRELVERCNKTDRIYSCQTMNLLPNGAPTQNRNYIIPVIGVIIISFLYFNG